MLQQLKYGIISSPNNDWKLNEKMYSYECF